MPPLVVPSPIILDHSFPRSEQELRIAAAALGGLVEKAATGEVQILLTPVLREFTESFDWTGNPAPLLVDVYRLHVQLFLQSTSITVELNLEADPPASHPLPCDLVDLAGSLSMFWRDEVGQMRARHDRVAQRPGFVGIACAEAWAGVRPTACLTERVDPPPLVTVGPDDLSGLDDAYSYVAERLAPTGASITVAMAKANIGLLGGVVREAGGTSHTQQVTFEGGRTWPIDDNEDPIRPAFLSELKPLTRCSLEVIRAALYYGDRPIRRLRLA